jgi:hypothetical protein
VTNPNEGVDLARLIGPRAAAYVGSTRIALLTAFHQRLRATAIYVTLTINVHNSTRRNVVEQKLLN